MQFVARNVEGNVAQCVRALKQDNFLATCKKTLTRAVARQVADEITHFNAPPRNLSSKKKLRCKFQKKLNRSQLFAKLRDQLHACNM